MDLFPTLNRLVSLRSLPAGAQPPASEYGSPAPYLFCSIYPSTAGQHFIPDSFHLYVHSRFVHHNFNSRFSLRNCVGNESHPKYKMTQNLMQSNLSYFVFYHFSQPIFSVALESFATKYRVCCNLAASNEIIFYYEKRKNSSLSRPSVSHPFVH